MKKVIASLVALLGFGSQSQAAATQPLQEKDVMAGLRQMALDLKPEEIGLNRSNFPKEAWGLLFETANTSGTYTLVVLADGTASLYFSNGGGIIGAGQHESVRKASANLLAGANQFYSSATRVSEFPMPEAGFSNFYFLTYGGVFRYGAKEIDLGEGRDKFSDLFHAAHYVIGQLREIEQKKHNK